MDWFAVLFLGAAGVAVLTGRAYFRGVVERVEQPRRYWSIVAGYVAIGALSAGFVRAPSAGSLPSITDFMTDAATRLARDLRDGAERLRSSGEASRIVVHRMKAQPEGCRHGFRVQLSAASTLVVWCRTEDGARIASSHSTTSHLPAVDVPRTWIVDKAAGEALNVELVRTGGKPAVARVF